MQDSNIIMIAHGFLLEKQGVITKESRAFDHDPLGLKNPWFRVS
jgi:hypothetical protein